MDRFDDPYDDTRIHVTPAVIEPGHTFGSVTDKISALVLRKRTPLGWWIGLAISFMLTNMMVGTIIYLVLTGIGILGKNQPVGCAFDINNFVWWIGFGYYGTLSSASLLLLWEACR